MAPGWIEVAVTINPTFITWRGPLAQPIAPTDVPAPDDPVSANLSLFLQSYLEPGREAQIAVNPFLQHVIVFVDGELLMTCGFEDLLTGPGFSSN